MSRRQRGSADPARAGSRPPEHRIGNLVFYVVAEGEGTEYDYLNGLNRSYGSVLRFLIKTPSPSVKRNGLTPSRVVKEACRVADEPAISQIWGLFDHDGRKDIDQVCLRQKPDRVRVALSHPSFELWLLLHFQEFPPVAQYGGNDAIIEKLRAAHRAFTDYGSTISESA